MASGSRVFTKIPIALMFAMDAKRNVSSATQSTVHATSWRSCSRLSDPLSAGGRIELSVMFAIPPSLHVHRAAVDPIFAVARAALHFEPRVADEEPEEDRVSTLGEVRLELELVVVDEHVTREPKRERILPVHRFVIAVVTPAEPIDVNERF